MGVGLYLYVLGEGKIKKRTDHYSRLARVQKYRARSAYKLLEINKKYDLLKKGDTVVDLGAWPGSWMQVASHIVGSEGFVLGIDKRRIVTIGKNAKTLMGDVLDEAIIEKIKEKIGRANVVLSDLAPNTSGNKDIDQFRSYELTERAFKLAVALLSQDGHFLAKTFQSGHTQKLLSKIKRKFHHVKTYVPRATRKGSVEVYIIALNRKS